MNLSDAALWLLSIMVAGLMGALTAPQDKPTPIDLTPHPCSAPFCIQAPTAGRT